MEAVTSKAMQEPLERGHLTAQAKPLLGLIPSKPRAVANSEFLVAQSTAVRMEPFLAQYGSEKRRTRALSSNIAIAQRYAAGKHTKFLPREITATFELEQEDGYDAIAEYLFTIQDEAARSGIVHPEQIERVLFAVALGFTVLCGDPELLGISVPVLQWLYSEDEPKPQVHSEFVQATCAKFPKLDAATAECFVLAYETNSAFVFTPEDLKFMRRRVRKGDAAQATVELLDRVIETNEDVGRVYNAPRITEDDLLFRLTQADFEKLRPLLNTLTEANEDGDDELRRAAHPWIDVFQTTRSAQALLGPGLFDIEVEESGAEDDEEESDDEEDEDYVPSEEEEDDDDDDEEEDDEDDDDDEEDDEAEDGEEEEDEELEPVEVASVVPATDTMDERVVLAKSETETVIHAAVETGLPPQAAAEIAETAVTVGLTNVAVESLGLVAAESETTGVVAAAEPEAAPKAATPVPTPKAAAPAVPTPVPAAAPKTATPIPAAAAAAAAAVAPASKPATPQVTPVPLAAVPASSKQATPVPSTPVPAVASAPATPTPKVIYVKLDTPAPPTRTPTITATATPTPKLVVPEAAAAAVAAAAATSAEAEEEEIDLESEL